MSEKSNMECMFSNGYLNEICYLYTFEKLMIKYGKYVFNQPSQQTQIKVFICSHLRN